MDIYTVKLKLMDLIAAADSRLIPRATHVLGNWHIQIWQKGYDKYPTVTVRLQGKQTPIWGFKPPTIVHGELYYYDFTAFVFSDSMQDSRMLADNIADYLGQHNKDATTHIIDIINIAVREHVTTVGPKRYWRMVVSGQVVTEETLT
jgi:hypothetical protein